MNNAENELPLQAGRGQKRSIDEVNDGAGTFDKVSNNNFLTMTDVKQVKVKKFNTTGIDYTVQFMDSLLIWNFLDFMIGSTKYLRVYLNAITKDIPAHDQVCFVLRSSQLENPISLPFLPFSRLTTERVLAEIEHVIPSNHEFRLNDNVQVNLVHVEMPNGGTGTKRGEINFEKHLINKRSIVRIQNKDVFCLA